MFQQQASERVLEMRNFRKIPFQNKRRYIWATETEDVSATPATSDGASGTPAMKEGAMIDEEHVHLMKKSASG